MYAESGSGSASTDRSELRKVRFVASRTIYRNTGQRVGLFVDVQNMFYSAKTLHRAKIDYSKLLAEVLQGRTLVRAIAYVVEKPEVDQSSFLDALERSGYEVKKKTLAVRENGTAKNDWNIGIALDAVAIAPRLDTMALVTGDGDFVPLVQALQAQGCRCEVVSFEQSTSNQLIRTCDQFIPIDTRVLFKEEKFARNFDGKRDYAPHYPLDAPRMFADGIDPE